MLQNNKKLTHSQRIQIEELLNQRQSKSQIAIQIDKSLSTVSREIHKHRIFKQQYVYSKDNFFNCKYFINCKICSGKCKMYMPIPCKERDRSIGVCNNCSKLKTCKLDKYFYFAKKGSRTL